MTTALICNRGRRTTLSLLSGFLLILLVSFNATGHRMHAALSTIEKNPHTGVVEIIHRLFIHDVEPALREIYGPDIDFFTQSNLETYVKDYVTAHFRIVQEDGALAPLAWIGAETDGDLLWVYQETTPLPPQQLTIHNTLLMDFADDQVNTLNITLNGASETLVFTRTAKEMNFTPD